MSEPMQQPTQDKSFSPRLIFSPLNLNLRVVRNNGIGFVLALVRLHGKVSI